MPTTKFVNEIIKIDQSLNAFAMSLTRDTVDAKELMQETHYRAIANEDKFTKGTNIKAWLYTIMRNIFINNYRKKSRRKMTLDDMGENSIVGNMPSENANVAESNLIISDLKKAIDELDPKYMLPFKMHFEGYKYTEIADTMKLHLGTVKSRIFHARKYLKAKLGSEIRYMN